ncbi:hypothetical protein M2347_002323 [Chryseobacterium sp. H1D6B]|uniref:hypothetical protein n=1 Tax=Chryseobacterium sp. H1D6B TaxID=2940588 RepID=UPI0015C7C3F2|nr:hypothetical protein [Chryseobacterium sp. H1D6B]MDH6252596.1 hypothetical protein [Chryseobacterium sp. H1D6B]
MKNSILSVLFFLSLVLFSNLLKAQDKDFNNFYFNYFLTFHSLGNFIESNDIFIYDEYNKISKTELDYEYEADSVSQKIHIVHSTPKTKNYLLLSDYIINENLAVISFASSNRKKYIIYTLKRTKNDNKWWDILSIHNGAMN